jgi:hypothetical protein
MSGSGKLQHLPGIVGRELAADLPYSGRKIETLDARGSPAGPGQFRKRADEVLAQGEEK